MAKKAWALVAVYGLLVYAGLYFTPAFAHYLIQRDWLSSFIFISYATAILLLVWFCYFKQNLRQVSTYTFLAILFLLFLAAIGRMEMTTDRLHFLEHGLFFVFLFAALKFSSEGIVLLGRTFLLSFFFGFLDETIQGWLPNRESSWQDLWSNIFAYYLAAGVLTLVRKTEVPPLEKADAFFLVGSIVGLLLWIKMAPAIPKDYHLIYLIGSFVLLLPLLYLVYCKKCFYQWSLEALIYLFFLTVTGVFSFSYSVLGIEPLKLLKNLSHSLLLASF